MTADLVTKANAYLDNARDAADAVMDLGLLTLAFGRVERVTRHPDGVRPETDTDHTVMLGLVACALARRFYPHLDAGIIAQFALVHDLPEVYAGDVSTMRALDDAGRASKAQREAAAVKRIGVEVGARLPWVSRVLANYEGQNSPEARFVRAVDKLLPKITHVADGGASLREHGIGPDESWEQWCRQRQDLQRYASDFPVLLDLHAELAGRAVDVLRQAEAKS